MMGALNSQETGGDRGEIPCTLMETLVETQNLDIMVLREDLEQVPHSVPRTVRDLLPVGQRGCRNGDDSPARRPSHLTRALRPHCVRVRPIFRASRRSRIGDPATTPQSFRRPPWANSEGRLETRAKAGACSTHTALRSGPQSRAMRAGNR